MDPPLLRYYSIIWSFYYELDLAAKKLSHFRSVKFYRCVKMMFDSSGNKITASSGREKLIFGSDTLNIFVTLQTLQCMQAETCDLL